YRRVPEPGARSPNLAGKKFSHTVFVERDDKSIELTTIRIPKLDITEGMEFFEGGEFTMGSPQFGPVAVPQHSRTIDAFYLDKTEVTVAEYRRARKEIPDTLERQHPGDNEAVRYVTFDEAVACAEELGKRLPDEAEYEYAATNVGKNRFPWGDDFERIKSWPIG